MTDKQLTEAIERMTSYMSSQTLMQINEEKYGYVRDGVPVTRLKPNGETELVCAKVIDFGNVDNNEFIAVRELWIKGPVHKRRADVVCFVNGLSLIFIELKNHDQDIQLLSVMFCGRKLPAISEDGYFSLGYSQSGRQEVPILQSIAYLRDNAICDFST